MHQKIILLTPILISIIFTSPSYSEAKQIITNEISVIDLWKELEFSSEIWEQITSIDTKILTISKAIEIYQSKNINIEKNPILYAEMIDDLASKNPNLLKQPFKDVLKFVAIIEYDFDNGKNPDMLAMKALGKEAYLQNKKRLGLK